MLLGWYLVSHWIVLIFVVRKNNGNRGGIISGEVIAVVFGQETPEEYKTFGFGIMGVSVLKRLKFHIFEKLTKNKTKLNPTVILGGFQQRQIMGLSDLSMQNLVCFLQFIIVLLELGQ